MNRIEEIANWLANCEDLAGYVMYINYLPPDLNVFAIISENSDINVLEEYIDGGRKVELYFNLQYVFGYGTAMGETNANALGLFEKIIGWIKSQNSQKNFPDFGNYIVKSVETVSGQPQLYIENDESKAAYEARFKIVYEEA